MEKKNIPYALVGLRAAAFIPIILSTFNVLAVPLISQLILTGIIMTSDIFDGKISRKYNDKKNRLRFRILDSVTDKTGIGFCLAGLILTHRISTIFAFLIIGYNSVLMAGGAISIASSKDKDEKNVRGLFLSRLFTALTGFSIILLNNFILEPLVELCLIVFMANIGANSLYEQLDDKLKQRREQKEKKENEEETSEREKSKEFENVDELEKVRIDQRAVQTTYSNVNNIDNIKINSKGYSRKRKRY